jgi:hypothetical protein
MPLETCDLKPYGWSEVTLAHDFYEVDYLPEKNHISYAISSEAKKEILQ